MSITSLNSLQQQIQKEAAQCVKCGLCLPHCPTYIQTKNECESPRGRIALMDGFANGQISLSKKAQLHLDHCLTCRACEAVCPAEVSYGKLIDHGRALQRQIKRKKSRILYHLLKNLWLLRLLTPLLRCYQKLGLQKFARKANLLKLLRLTRADSFLPTLRKPPHLAEYYPAQTSHEKETVALFTGCINPLIDQDTLTATIDVLTRCGYNVYVPREQRCCGALHQHAGYADIAKRFIKINLCAFQTKKINTIITIASGCAAMLCEYPVTDFSQKIKDISQFLTTIDWPKDLKFNPLPQRVALHTPCTLRNVLNQATAPEQLLKKIPSIELIPVTSVTQCCGAAGTYMLQHPQMSDALLENTLKQVEQLKPDWIATSNIGCRLHLARGLREKKLALPVIHPIILINQQLRIH